MSLTIYEPAYEVYDITIICNGITINYKSVEHLTLSGNLTAGGMWVTIQIFGENLEKK